eukprot:1584287-Prymnesium_polylepis.1
MRGLHGVQSSGRRTSVVRSSGTEPAIDSRVICRLGHARLLDLLQLAARLPASPLLLRSRSGLVRRSQRRLQILEVIWLPTFRRPFVPHLGPAQQCLLDPRAGLLAVDHFSRVRL